MSVALHKIEWLDDAIRRIGRAAFNNVYWPTIDRVIQTYDKAHSVFAFSNTGQLQGFILVTDDPLINNDRVVARYHIEFVAVDTAFEGKGIGSSMMKAALQVCNTNLQDYRLHSYWLHVDTINVRAASIYKKYGFRVWSHEPDEFGYEGDIMVHERRELHS
jgi:ribosomal protein S18 acetylase RimI-like enzyme